MRDTVKELIQAAAVPPTIRFRLDATPSKPERDVTPGVRFAADAERMASDSARRRKQTPRRPRRGTTGTPLKAPAATPVTPPDAMAVRGAVDKLWDAPLSPAEKDEVRGVVTELFTKAKSPRQPSAGAVRATQRAYVRALLTGLVHHVRASRAR